MLLKAFNNTVFRPIGYVKAIVEYNNVKKVIKFYVVDNVVPVL